MTRKEKQAFNKMDRMIDAGWTVKQIAVALGYKSHSSVSNWYSRNRIPSYVIDRILKLKEKK